MRLSNSRFLSTVLATLAILSFLSLAAHSQAFAASESILWASANGSDANNVSGTLFKDTSGNLYGTSFQGGTSNSGTVFELMPPSSSGGKWSESVLWSFANGSDGAHPKWVSLIMDGKGNLYGTTAGGGANNQGTVFELSPPTTKGGNWTESVLWRFRSGNDTDGSGPQGGLIMDASGNLFGTTLEGGTDRVPGSLGGTVFELSPPATPGGPWSESILWSFGNGSDGDGPFAGLLMDTGGNLYGTTAEGGAFPTVDANGVPLGGTVFELTPPSTSGGLWTESILWSFNNGADGNDPQGGLIMDASGNLYGTTIGGGTNGGAGTVFELSPAGGGGWTESVLWNFGNGSDGAGPWDTLVMDTGGDLYGTTRLGGTHEVGTSTQGAGTVFELTPPITIGGNWTESVMWNFGDQALDGRNSTNGLIIDTTGNLYGTTNFAFDAGGGPGGAPGTVFEISRGGPPSMGKISVSTNPIVLKGKPGKPKSKKLKVKNIGTGPLDVIGTQGLSAPLSSSGRGTIAPKKSLTIDVTDAPTTGKSTATQTLKILSNDPNRPEVDISVTGNSP